MNLKPTLKYFAFTLVLSTLLISLVSASIGQASVLHTDQAIEQQAQTEGGAITSMVPVQERDYPLIGWQTFNGAVDDFYGRYELLVYRTMVIKAQISIIYNHQRIHLLTIEQRQIIILAND